MRFKLYVASWLIGSSIVPMQVAAGVGRHLPARPEVPFISSPYSRLHLFQDWVIACDNTRRCQAVGYQADSDPGEPVALVLARGAGPQQKIVARFTFAKEPPPHFDLKIGSLHLRNIQEELTPTQTTQLLPWLAKNKLPYIELSQGRQNWRVSLADAEAALSKIDELQGRTGSSGAIIQKGRKNEPQVPAWPLKTIPEQALPPTSTQDKALLAPIFTAIPKQQACPSTATEAPSAGELFRLSAHEVLITVVCWRAAYQEGSSVWVAHDTPPYSPRKLDFPSPYGTPIDYPTFFELGANGHATSFHKGNSSGDCVFNAEWAWNGSSFNLLQASASGLCKGFPGGVPLQLWRTQNRP